MVTLRTSLGLFTIEPGEYEYRTLFSLVIKQFKTPFKETHALIKELRDRGYIRRFETPEGLARYAVVQVFRLSKVHMYYARIKKKATPDPFAELRVFVFTTNPEGWEARLDEALKRLEWIFFSLGDSLKQNKITAEIQGLEVEPVDFDEVTEPLDQIQRYFALYDELGKIKKEYDETQISKLELIRAEKYRGWISKLAEQGKLKPELERKHKRLEEGR